MVENLWKNVGNFAVLVSCVCNWRVMQSSKKHWLVVSNMTQGISWILTQPLKSLEFFFRWAIFVQSILGLTYKNIEELSFMTLDSNAKFEENLTLWFHEWHEELGEFSLEHSKVWKIVLWWTHFVQSIKCSRKFHINYV